MSQRFVYVVAPVALALACALAPGAAHAAKPAVAAPKAASSVQKTPAAGRSKAMSPVARTLPSVLVHKSPTCGCCMAWVEHMRKSGFAVEVRNSDDLDPVKERLGVPDKQHSCHTAEVGGYFVEGHVPADDVKRLLAEKPAARGIAVPGMPLGSPGMEVPGRPAMPYVVELVGKDGKVSPYAKH
jgi:hypothetical protein